MCIIITSASTIYGTDIEVTNAVDLGRQLEPLLGSWAKYVMGIGLFGAGISSSITAPLAAAYCARGIFNWTADDKDVKFRGVWFFILILGIGFSSLGIKPIQIIQVAQIANGLLLPIVAIFLLYIMNKKSLLKEYVNTPIRNTMGIVIVGLTLLLAFKSFNAVFKFF